MSIFGSSASAICADYFGDELPLPLPQVKEEMRKRPAEEIKPTQVAGSTNSVAAAKNRVVLFGSSAAAICADYFGDDLPFLLPQLKSEKTQNRPAQGTPNNQWKIHSTLQSAFPSFGGLFSFETFKKQN